MRSILPSVGQKNPRLQSASIKVKSGTLSSSAGIAVWCCESSGFVWSRASWSRDVGSGRDV